MAGARTLFVDGHAHLHPGWNPERFLDGALTNFEAAARAHRSSHEPLYYLALCGIGATDAFASLWRRVERGGVGRWSLQRTSESHSLIACRDPDREVVLVAGWQVRTVEGLEVLALCRAPPVPAGLSLGATVQVIRALGGIVVLPWGFGKWWFGRGREVRELLLSTLAKEVFLGDNGGRPKVLRDPALFHLARERRRPILPGSDPLPLPVETVVAARFGFLLEGVVDLSCPAAALRMLLEALDQQPLTFGARVGVLRFASNQILLRLRRGGGRNAKPTCPREGLDRM